MSAADTPPLALLRLARAPTLEHAGAAIALPLLDAAMLAWLALEGPTPRARLATLLWPGSASDAARNSLRQRLFKLRRVCGLDLVAGSTTLALAAGVAHDLENADGRGLVGEFDDWLERQRARRRDRLRQSLVELCEMAEHAGDWADAVAHASELLALAPLSEEAHRRLMRLHYLAGDRSAAMLAFDRCEQVLKDEVGARPSAETLALLRTVEQAAPALPVVVAAPRVPASVLRPPRLIGRDGAWQALREAWDAGHASFVTGEGGLGKSRLAGDFGLAQGRVVVAGARPGDERVAYASFSRLLRALPRATWPALAPAAQRELARLLPELGDAPPLAGGGERARFFNAVAALFAPGAGHVDGIVFDDLHFADEASIELLQYVVAAAPQHWIVTAREAEVSPAGRRWLGEALARPEVLHLPLAPLTLAQVAELVDSLGIAGLSGAAVAPALLQRSGGNPLMLLETVKAGLQSGDVANAAGLPAVAGLHRLVERRIARLSMPAVQLARCAAIATPDFSIELAAHVLALRTIDLADPWAELEAAQVLVDGAFAHDLIYEAALASVPAPVARQLHAEVAGFLAVRGGEPARLARHWLHAGRWSEAGGAYVAAAARARDASRSLEQAGLLQEAAACFERAGRAEDRFDALAQRARVLGDSVLGAEARAAVDEVAALAQSPAQQLHALELRLLLSMGRAEVHETLDIGREALAAARGLGRTDLELRFAIAVADALCDLRRGAEAVALLQDYGDVVREQADPDAHWDYWHGLGMALDYADRLREALPAWETGRRVAQRAGRQDMVWKTMASGAATLAKMGFVRRSAQQYEQACRVALAADELTLRVHQMRVPWAHRLRDLGRYDEALAMLEEALAAFTAGGGGAADRAGTEHRLAQLYQQLGQPARAAQLLATERPGVAPGLAMMRQVHRADVAHQLGRDGLPAMREALAVIENTDDIYHRIGTLFATRLVPADEGEALATSLAAWASARERLGVALAGHVRAAACALAQGAPMRARPHAEAALHLAREREPDSFYLPEMWLVAGDVEAALGHAARAAQRWRDGLAWVQQVADAHVPAPFRDSFWHRNAVNAALRARPSAP